MGLVSEFSGCLTAESPPALGVTGLVIPQLLLKRQAVHSRASLLGSDDILYLLLSGSLPCVCVSVCVRESLLLISTEL